MSIITIKERVDAIKEGSSAYNYYMSTPLSELKSRDEKLIKQELEKRSLKLLSESDDEEELDNNTTTQVDDTEELEYPNDILDKTLKGAAIGAGTITGATAVAGTGLGIAMIPWQDIYSGFTTWISGLKESIVGLFKTKQNPNGYVPQGDLNSDTNGSGNLANNSGYVPVADLNSDTNGSLISNQFIDLKERFPQEYGNLNLNDLRLSDLLYLNDRLVKNKFPEELESAIRNTVEKFEKQGSIELQDNGSYKVRGPNIKITELSLSTPNIPYTEPNPTWYQSIYNSGASAINSFANWVDKGIVAVQNKYSELITKEGTHVTADPNNPSTASYTIVWTIIVAIIIIAVYGIWKLVKWFIKDNGEEKSEDEVKEMEENPEEAAASEGLEYSFYTDRLEPINEMENPFSKHFNPLYNNVSLAILKESDEAEAAMNTDSDRFSVKIAIKLSGKLANDSKFVNYMSKTVPVILKAVEQYSNVAKPEAVTESLLYEADESIPVLPEETEDVSVEDQKGFFTRSWDMIADGIKKAGLKISSSVSSLKDKIVNLYVNLDDGTIRWIPTIVTTAITILAGVAAYLMMKNGNPNSMNFSSNIGDKTQRDAEFPDTKDPKVAIRGVQLQAQRRNVEAAQSDNAGWNRAFKQSNPETQFMNTDNIDFTSDKSFSLKLSQKDLPYFLKESITALSLFNEAVENNIKKGADPFTGLSGKGEKLANNILDKAFKVSVDYVKDDEFITFYKKYNPEYLTTMKKYVNSDYKKAKGSKLVKATPNVKK